MPGEHDHFSLQEIKDLADERESNNLPTGRLRRSQRERNINVTNPGLSTREIVNRIESRSRTRKPVGDLARELKKKNLTHFFEKAGASMVSAFKK